MAVALMVKALVVNGGGGGLVFVVRSGGSDRCGSMSGRNVGGGGRERLW